MERKRWVMRKQKRKRNGKIYMNGKMNTKRRKSKGKKSNQMMSVEVDHDQGAKAGSITN
jgi:hypothetical protein